MNRFSPEREEEEGGEGGNCSPFGKSLRLSPEEHLGCGLEFALLHQGLASVMQRHAHRQRLLIGCAINCTQTKVFFISSLFLKIKIKIKSIWVPGRR
jgi:hypothetical protein